MMFTKWAIKAKAAKYFQLEIRISYEIKKNVNPVTVKRQNEIFRFSSLFSTRVYLNVQTKVLPLKISISADIDSTP